MGLGIIKAFHKLFSLFFSCGFCPRAAVGVCGRDRDVPEGSGGPRSPLVSLSLSQELRMGSFLCCLCSPGSSGEEENSPCSCSGFPGRQRGDGSWTRGQAPNPGWFLLLHPRQEENSPHSCPGVTGQQGGDDGCSWEGLEPPNQDNSGCFSLLSRQWEINGQWACCDGVIGKPLPFLCLQGPVRVPGVAVTSA